MFKKNNKLFSINYSIYLGSSLAFKAGAVLFSIILIPLFLKYLESEIYGIWLTIYSIVGWLSLLDGGLGNGLKNKLSIALANGNLEEAKKYVSTTYIGLFSIMFLLNIFLLLCFPFINFSRFINSSPNLTFQINVSFLIVLLLFSLKFVTDLIISVLLSKQKSLTVNILSFVINGLILLCCFFVLPLLKEQKLIYVSIIISFIPVIVMLFYSWYVYRFQFPNLKPSLKDFEVHYLKDLLSLGLKFFVIQIAVIIIFSTDNIIIINLLGAKYVTTYNIAFKLFSVFTLGWNIVLMPYWPAFTKASVKNDLVWIKKTVRFLEKLWVCLLIIVIATLYFVNDLYYLWIGNKITIPFNLSIAMAFFVLISTLTNIYVYVINGMGKLKLQFFTSIIVGIINIPLCIFMVKTFKFGLTGIISATCLCLSFGLIVSYIQYYKIVNSKDTGIWSN